MADALQAPRPGGPDNTKTPDERVKVHRAETKTRTPVEARRAGPTLDVVKGDERVKVFIRSANQQTGAIGYTEHGERHANTSADGARFILKSLGHDARRCAIANHEEDEGGLPVSAVSAAVIIANHSHDNRRRVRNPKSTSFDIHARVNYAVTAS